MKYEFEDSGFGLLFTLDNPQAFLSSLVDQVKRWWRLGGSYQVN